MARPEKNTVDYFPFICAEGKKMYYLEETYGNDGFATFIKILRELANTEFHYLELSKNNTKMYLSAKCKVPKETLELIIADLVELGKFDKAFWDEFEVIWCQDFVDSIQDAYKKRMNKCLNKKSLRELLNGLSNPKLSLSKSQGTVKPQRKEKKNKEEKKRKDLGEITPLPSPAYDLLKIKSQVQLTDFEMQNKKLVKKWQDLVDNFNDTVDIEISKGKIDFEVQQLMPRLRKYTRSWINNQTAYSKTPKPESYESGKLERF